MNITGVLAEVRKRWFLLGIIFVIVLAKLLPSIGAKGGAFVKNKVYELY